MTGGAGPFTAADFAAVAELVLDAWASAVDRDWSVPAGTLDWSCFDTADHTIDCVFSYALFLASRKQDAYPTLGELHLEPGSTPADVVDGLRAVTTMLTAVILEAAPGTRAVIRRHPQIETGDPADFAARGAHELILHAHDVCTGLGVRFQPPADLCRRLWDHTAGWFGVEQPVATADPWSDLLARSGRPRVDGG